MNTIVYDHNIFSIQTYGGVSRYICAIAQHINKVDGWRTQILAGFYLNNYLKSIDKSIVKGQYFPRIPRFKPSFLRRRINDHFSKIQITSNPPNIFHETWLTPLQLSPPTSRYIITIHDMIHERLLSRSPNPRIQREVALKDIALKRSDHIICISENTRRDLLDIKDIDPKKVSVVYHGCNLKKTNVENKNKINSRKSIPYILYVGERGDQDCHKNFTNLLKAYGENNRLKKDFNLLCFGAGGFKQHELRLMLSLNIPLSKVKHQKGNDIQLAQAYENATAVVSPSLYEGFGLPLIEAMTLGSPLVCSRSSCFPEIAGNAAKYFNPKDTESISSAIEEVVFSRSIQKDLIQKGLERSINFTWEKTAKKTLEVYKKQL